MPTIDSKEAVKSAYDYLMKASPNSNRFSDFRLEEMQSDEQGDFLITLSYEVAGEFGFDRQKEYKDFKVLKEDSTVVWMKIRKL